MSNCDGSGPSQWRRRAARRLPRQLQPQRHLNIRLPNQVSPRPTMRWPIRARMMRGRRRQGYQTTIGGTGTRLIRWSPELEESTNRNQVAAVAVRSTTVAPTTTSMAARLVRRTKPITVRNRSRPARHPPESPAPHSRPEDRAGFRPASRKTPRRLGSIVGSRVADHKDGTWALIGLLS